MGSWSPLRKIVESIASASLKQRTQQYSNSVIATLPSNTGCANPRSYKSNIETTRAVRLSFPEFANASSTSRWDTRLSAIRGWGLRMISVIA